MRRGIFGGTFNPIHHGHIHAIAYALDTADLDVIHVMVAGDPYQKNEIVVDDREVLRSGPTYTIDTLRELQEEFLGDELVLIVGEDIVKTISTWNNADEIAEISEMFVVPRSIFPTSSTYIRTAIRDKKPITGLLPASIEAEILSKSLYN